MLRLMAITCLVLYGLLAQGCATWTWDDEYKSSSDYCTVHLATNVLIKCTTYRVRCAKFGRDARHFCVRDKL